jgi:hypothetical protein
MKKATIAVLFLIFLTPQLYAQHEGKPGDGPSETDRNRKSQGTFIPAPNNPFPDPGTTGLLIQQLTFTDYKAADNNPKGGENWRQCNNGQNLGAPTWNWLTDWTTPMRLTTDWRSGGCDWKMGVVDSGNRFTGTELHLKWGPEQKAVDYLSPGSASDECANEGTFNVLVSHGVPSGPWMRRIVNPEGKTDNQESLRIDTDTRPNACPLTFDVFSEPKNKIVEWNVRIYNPGIHSDQAICGQASAAPEAPPRIASVGHPVTFVLNMHDGASCEMTMRLAAYRATTITAGATLRTIAKTDLGSANRWSEIVELNKDRIPDPSKLKAGLKIKLPEK